MEVLMTASEYRQEARNLLQGLWTPLVPIWFIYLMIAGASGYVLGLVIPVIGSFASLIIGGPMMMGVTKICLRIYNRQKVELVQLFEGFSEFGRTFTAYILMVLFIFLWTLLLIVPGILPRWAIV